MDPPSSGAIKKYTKSSVHLTQYGILQTIIKLQSNHEGGTIVHVAASQDTSSKLCRFENPIALKPSKLPSPSIYVTDQSANVPSLHIQRNPEIDR